MEHFYSPILSSKKTVKSAVFKFGLMVAFFLLSFVGKTQTVTIGTGTTTQSYLPIYSCYGYNYSQQIYTAAEISAAGGTAGSNITTIAFKVGATAYATANFLNWSIYLGNTGLNNFASTTGWVPLASMTNVWNGNIPTLTANGWMTITLTTPFTWTGGNLVVAIDENTASYTCTQAWYSFTATAAAGPRSILYYNDATNPNPASPPTANYSSTTVRAQVQFTMIANTPCSGTPAPGNTLATLAAVPPGSSTTLTLQNSTPGNNVIYQWQSAPTSTGPWTNVGTSTNSYSPTINAMTWFRCLVICGGNQGISNPVQIDLGPCVPSGSTTYYLSNTNSTGGISNIATTGSSAGGYGNYYATQTVSQYPGMSFVVNLTPSITTDYFHVWVDWNNDFDFLDAGETIYISSGYLSSASVTVPIGAGQAPGNYRMRVANSYIGTVGSCGPASYGEYEDYKLTVLVPPPCSGTPTPGNTVANVTSCPPGTSINLSLQTATIGTGITYQWQSAPSATGPWTNIGTSSPTLTQVINANIWYQCIVSCSGGGTGTSNPVQITLGPCVPAGFTSSSSYYITNFNTVGGVTNINNPSGPAVSGGYSNYSNLSCSQVAGSNITFNINTIYSSDYFYIWVDWNDDYDFLDANEAVFVGTGYIANPALNYTIPAGTPSGPHRLRIAHNYLGSIASACGPSTYGEFEDYTIIVIPPPTSPTINASTFTYCLNGVSLTPATAAPANVTYYWQTNATGTSTTNSANPYTVYGNGTYYLRAYNSLYNLWATTSTSTVVSAFPTVTPPTAIIVNSPSCPSASLTMGSAPAGVNYYWQGTNSAGFSTTNNATASYTASSTGTYYVRAQDANGCWSDNTSSLVTVYTAPNATANFVAPPTCGTNGQIVF
ncbi:MAG: GEVED domain-containing protein, partial [Flavobacteriales bacterium]